MGMKLQIRRGKKASLPALAPGEPGLCTDTGEVFIGSEDGNLAVGGAADDMRKSVYDTDGDGVVDAAAAVPWAGVTGKPAAFPAASHTHSKSQITDLPASLPANGGNADTVDGKHAGDFMLQANAGEIYRKELFSGATLGGLGRGHYVSNYSANTFPDAPDGADTAFILDVDGIQAWNTEYTQQRLQDNLGEAAAVYFLLGNDIYNAPVYRALHADTADKIRIGGSDASIFYNEKTDWVYVNRNGKIVNYHQARYAVEDESGNNIKSTYIAGVDHSGNALRFKNKNGTVLFSETPPYATNAQYANDSVLRFAASGGYIHTPGAQKMYFWTSNESDRGLFFGVQSIWTLCPNTDNALWLGTSNHRWNQIYSTQAAISTSDRNRKTEIAALDPAVALEFLQALAPVSYKMQDGSSGRTHWGLIAQDVWQAMQQVGLSDMDFAGYCRDVAAERVQVIRQKAVTDPEDGDLLGVEEALEDEELPATDEDGAPKYLYGLRYEEFVPLALLGAQEALRRADEAAAARKALQEQNAALQEALAALAQRQAEMDKRLAALEEGG